MAKTRKLKITKLGKIFVGFGITIIILLISFIIASSIFLSPVNSSSEETIEFSVKEGASKNSIADSLKDSGLIRSSLFFKFYIKFNSDMELYAGTYLLSPSMSVNNIIHVLNSNNSIENKSVNITFVEGKRIKDYAKQISETFNFDEEEVIKFIDSDDFVNKMINNYWFITEEVKNKDIYHPLEGYLFPDTYAFKVSSSIEDVVTKMISTMGKKLEVYKEEIEASKYTVHELLTLASIIELEGINKNDRDNVASVFYNRLKKGDTLGADSTTYYGVNKDFTKELSRNNLRACNGYNTRNESTCVVRGIPVGSICSPSLSSINASILPAESDYYYFAADKNNVTYFFEYYTDFQSKISELKKSGLWYEF